MSLGGERTCVWGSSEYIANVRRTFESTALRLLLEWASSSVEHSINAPTLPHAIIVLNDSKTSIDEEEWDSSIATKRLMDHVANAIHTQPIFQGPADYWRKKGKRIDSMLDLFRCYYADISVVRIPTKGRYMLADAQINKLHHKIIVDCDASFRAKNDAHMLSNADELNRYLQAGFDHFATKEDQPFNFVEVALKNNPIPRDFGDHILGLAVKVREVTNLRDGPMLFEKLGLIVASSIFIDCIRQRRPGRPLITQKAQAQYDQLTDVEFPGKAADLFDQFYGGSCTAALEHFFDKFWPCSFTSKKGQSCVNVKSSHSAKGHQNAKGKVLKAGPYQSKVSSKDFGKTWQVKIKDILQDLEGRLAEKKSSRFINTHSNTDGEGIAYDLHCEAIGHFFSRII